MDRGADALPDAQARRLARNLADIQARIKASAESAGRSASEVTLLPVTKYASLAAMQGLLDLDIHCFGENQVQMTLKKRDALGPSVSFQMIGHLQRNKVKRALTLFTMIQSLDSMRLAECLSDRIAAAGAQPMPVLLEVNMGEEPNKHGFMPDAVLPALSAMGRLSGLSIKGFMTVPPYLSAPSDVRPFFAGLRKIRDAARQAGLGDGTLEVLSMGMSHDFEEAIQEGATVVRVGSALFAGLD